MGTESVAQLPERDLASCLTADPVSEYFDALQRRVTSAWVVPDGIPVGARVVLAFSIAADGELTSSSIIEGDRPELSASALEALQSAAPLPPVPDACGCLVDTNLLATFSVPTE